MALKDAKSILVTGGTGSFGKAFVSRMLRNYSNIERLVIFSRDELKQWEMQNAFPDEKYPQLRFFLGDIRDKERLRRALKNIDIIVHAAALKQVPAAEYNPSEFIKTNVLGADNLVDCALDCGVRKIVALSTDKAVSPVNLYGATKLCSDKLFISANNITGTQDSKFSVVRYGNVMGSRGSIIPLLISKAKKNEPLTITHKDMTRFNITLDEGVSLVISTIEEMIGGEIFVPKIPSYRIMDLAKAISPNAEVDFIGMRVGEKIHEEMLSINDAPNTIDLGDKYAILPAGGDLQKSYKSFNISFKNVDPHFCFNSGTNENFLEIEEIQDLIVKNVDRTFRVRNI